MLSVVHARDLPETKLKTATLAYCGLLLRDAVSLFSKVETNQAEISKLTDYLLTFLPCKLTTTKGVLYCLDNC